MKEFFSIAKQNQKHLYLNFWWQRLTLILLLIILFSSSILAQTKLWDKAFGGSDYEDLSSLHLTADGGFILGGYSNSEVSGDKSDDKTGFWIIKLNADGTKEWDKTFDGGRGTVQQTQDGGYILGRFSAIEIDYRIVKLDSTGTKVWEKSFGGDGTDQLTYLQQTSDDGYILGGYSYSGKSADKSEVSKGDSDYWVIKLDAAGNKEWDKSFGGSKADELTSLQQTSDGGYILGGRSGSGKSGDKSEGTKGGLDCWLLKLNADGTKVWDNTFGGNRVDELSSLQQTTDGGYILGSYSNSDVGGDKSEASKGYEDYWILKLNADGTKQWDKTIGGDHSDVLSSIQQTRDGGYILGGSSTSSISGDKSESRGGSENYDYWVVKLDVAGNKIWDKTLGWAYSDELIALRQTSDGNYILGGTSVGIGLDKTESKGKEDYWIVKVRENGKKGQTITFGAILNKTISDSPFLLSAQASSGLPVSFSVVSGPATVKDNIITLTGTGTVTIKASQAGNNIYNPAFEIYRNFLVEAATPISILWDKSFGYNNTDVLTTMLATADGGFLLGGTSESGIGGDKSEATGGGSDYWIVKIDAIGNKVWDRTFGGNNGDDLAALIATTDGGYLLGGTSNSNKSGDKSEDSRSHYFVDYWVVKVDGNGKKLWDKTLGGSKGDGLTSLQQTSDGGYILGGYSESGKSGDKSEASKGYNDYWIVKLNADGTKAWDKTFGGSHFDNLTALQQTSDGGYMLGGSSGSNKSGDKSENRKGDGDYWIVKINAAGQKEWDKTLGGSREDVLTLLQQTSDGGYILGGRSQSGKSGDKSEANKGHCYTQTYCTTDFWVIKLKADGIKIWDKTLGSLDDEEFGSLVATTDGGFLLGGTSRSGIGGDKSQVNRSFNGPQDYWIIKLNAAGQKEWDNTIGGESYDYLTSLLQTIEGEYILGGSSGSNKGGDKSAVYKGGFDYWIIKIKEKDTPPNPKAWNLRYGGSGIDRFTVVIKTSDGGYLSGGYSNSEVSGDKSQQSRGGADYWIVKTDEHGLKQWDKRYGGSNHDYLNRIILTQDGGYLLAGSSTSGKGGDKSEGSRGDQDYWIVKITSSGVKEWDKTYGGAGFDDLRKVNQLSNGDYLLAGTSDSEVSGEKSQSSQGGKDFWIVWVSSTGTKLWDKTYGGSGEENLESFTKTSAGGFLLAGSSTSGKSGNKSQASRGGKDYWLVRINSQGKQLWDKSYGGSKDDELYSIGITPTGEYFVAGHSHSGQSGDKSQARQGASDYWMLQLSSTGEKLWDKSFGGSGTETLRSIIQMPDGGYVLAGSSNSPISGDKTQASQGGMDYWIVKTDTQGNKEYDRRYGGSGNEEFRYIQRTADGGLLLGGRSDSGVSGDRTQPSQGSTDYWLVKIMPPTTTVARQVVAVKSETLAAVNLNAYPNPATSGQVTVTFSVPKTQPVQVQVYDSQGRVARTLFRGEAQTGQEYKTTWSTKNQPTGMYFLRLQTQNKSRTQKLMVLK